MTEYIVQIEDSEKNMSERFVGQLRSYPELIRCEECKYHTAYHECTNEHWDSKYSPDYPVVDNTDYCSRAERKKNG